MKLIRFHVSDFRSINDSGPIDTTKTTAIVGRNESGKTNLLLALQSLNPAEGVEALVPIKDFPRHRRLEECTDSTRVLVTTWELDEAESRELAGVWPRATDARQLTISRDYKGSRRVGFVGVSPPEVPAKDARKLWQSLRSKLARTAEAATDQKPTLEAKIGAVDTAIGADVKPLPYLNAVMPTLTALRAAFTTGAAQLSESDTKVLDELTDFVAGAIADFNAHTAAREWAVKQLPVFVFLDEYPEFDGHQDVSAYLVRKAQGHMTSSDRNFEKLCKVAGLDPQQLSTLNQQGDHETRNQLANRAGAVVTSELRRLWKDRALKVRFSPDAQHINTLISDPNTVYDVEVNLDERSRGFRWFFSFYLTFAADTKGGMAEKAIILLDEPGLFLHASSQTDLLSYLRITLSNQVVFTTHSPFMVPVDDLDSIRTVEIDQDTGTTVSNSPKGDERTLFPLQAALGYSVAQTLFTGTANLVVEGVTDFWYLSAVREHLRSTGKTALPDEMVITPAGGAQKISYMVALLASERFNVLVLLDREAQSEQTRALLTKTKLIRDESVLFVTEGFESAPPIEADIEDLLDASVFDDLVKHVYGKELAGKSLNVNAKIPRIVKRYEAAFGELGVGFHKTRPAREFLARIAKDPATVLSASATKRFEKLFKEISKSRSKQKQRGGGPFG